MRRTVGFVSSLILLCTAVLTTSCQHAEVSTASIAAADLAQRIRSGAAPVILDVRTPAEYSAGHIPGAINIPHSELATRLAEIPASKSAEIVVHCQAGGRAAKAESTLTQAGYTNVRDLQGHMGGWVQAGFPVDAAKGP
ncbi:MAG: rhodanese-like domain-containing protein [Deltaproteobacteria bacterium]|nr:rhodanese-like domain-containing protein [Deltaproteobacteria bacterium]